MHMAKMLSESGGFPVGGNQRSEWDAGASQRVRTPSTADPPGSDGFDGNALPEGHVVLDV